MIYQVEVNIIGTYWLVDGKFHREGGLPAVELFNGDKFWFVNGVQHREDGPANQFGDGRRKWYLNGTELTEEEFNNWSAVKELSVADIEALLGYKVKIVK